MTTLMEKYIEKNGQTLRVSVYYNLGGFNYFTSRSEERGYYLSVTPIKRSSNNGIVMREYAAFSGFKKLLLEVKRKSKKAESQALELASDELIEELITAVMKKREESTVATV